MGAINTFQQIVPGKKSLSSIKTISPKSRRRIDSQTAKSVHPIESAQLHKVADSLQIQVHRLPSQASQPVCDSTCHPSLVSVPEEKQHTKDKLASESIANIHESLDSQTAPKEQKQLNSVSKQDSAHSSPKGLRNTQVHPSPEPKQRKLIMLPPLKLDEKQHNEQNHDSPNHEQSQKIEEKPNIAMDRHVRSSEIEYKCRRGVVFCINPQPQNADTTGMSISTSDEMQRHMSEPSSIKQVKLNASGSQSSPISHKLETRKSQELSTENLSAKSFEHPNIYGHETTLYSRLRSFFPDIRQTIFVTKEEYPNACLYWCYQKQYQRFG